MGYHNKDHKFRRIISKYKFQRIYHKNIDCRGVAYRTVKDGEVQRSRFSVKVGDIIYAEFVPNKRNTLKEITYIRYYVGDKYSLDSIAFHPFNPDTIAFIKTFDHCGLTI